MLALEMSHKNRAQEREPAILAAHLEELQVDLVGQSFYFYTAYQKFRGEACLFPNIWGKQMFGEAEQSGSSVITSDR